MSLKDYIIQSGKLPKKSTKTLSADYSTEVYNRAIKAEREKVDKILMGIEEANKKHTTPPTAEQEG